MAVAHTIRKDSRMILARALPGLPPYGEPAISFPPRDAFREGTVVEFDTGNRQWVGNFADGWRQGVSSLHTELGARAIVVVASGAGYVVDATSQTLRCEFGDVTSIWFEPEIAAMIVSNDLWFHVFDAEKPIWTTRRISWDGMRNIQRDELVLRGEAYSPIEDDWSVFEVDLRSGSVAGGSYTGP